MKIKCFGVSDSVRNGVYHGDDVERLRTNDVYVRRFLLHQHRNLEKAANMMDMSLRFRKEYDVNGG